jgi:hypothetical protein
METKRRPTQQIVRLLEIVEQSNRALIRSENYATVSQHKYAPNWRLSIQEMKAMRFGFKAALEWVLGIGLTQEQSARVLTELDEQYEASLQRD